MGVIASGLLACGGAAGRPAEVSTIMSLSQPGFAERFAPNRNITPGRLMTDEFELTDRAKAWITGIRQIYESVVPGANDAPQPAQIAEAGNFKML